MKSLRVAAAGGGGGSAAASAAAASDDLLGAVVGDPMEGDYYGNSSFEDERIFPFELEMLEGALMVATGGPGWGRMHGVLAALYAPPAHCMPCQVLARWVGRPRTLKVLNDPQVAAAVRRRGAKGAVRQLGRRAWNNWASWHSSVCGEPMPGSSPPPVLLPCPPAAGKLDAELVAATRRVSSMLQKLPREITPVNLEELRRVKQLLVELESKAENMR